MSSRQVVTDWLLGSKTRTARLFVGFAQGAAEGPFGLACFSPLAIAAHGVSEDLRQVFPVASVDCSLYEVCWLSLDPWTD